MTLEWGACVFPHRWIFLLQQISQKLPSSVLSFRPTSEPLSLRFAQFILLDNRVHFIVCKGEQKKMPSIIQLFRGNLMLTTSSQF